MQVSYKYGELRHAATEKEHCVPYGTQIINNKLVPYCITTCKCHAFL